MSPRFLDLLQLLKVGRPADTEVAFGPAGTRSWADFETRVAALLPAIAAAGPGRWLLYSEDSYASAVGLMALAHAGTSAVLAPNGAAGTLRRLRGDLAGAIVDPGVGEEELAGMPRLHALEPVSAPSGAQDWELLDPAAPFAEFYTSGTSGPGKSVPKALRHLDEEVRYLETRFGDELGESTRIFATVSHQHVYGLLFRTLWPLAAGRPFCTHAYLQPGELLPRMRRSGDCALMATPTHLRRIKVHVDLPGLAGTCRAVFSSGGPLDEATALAIDSALGSAPHEIFGSTETGGVAWRQAGRGKPRAWTLFAPVHIEREEQDGRLIVTSPFVSVGEETGRAGEARFTMGDRMRPLEGGGFELLGRADRDVKIGEKRVSLPEMEARLRGHGLVAEAALVALEQAGEMRLAAVVVPTEAGRTAIGAAGRRTVGRILGEHLAADWDRVLLPRAWRYVDELPRDHQGKITAPALASLFDTEEQREAEEKRPREPILESEERGPDHLVRRLRVPADLAHLEGHFEGLPIVPGVVQLGWALSAARELTGRAPRLRAVEALKFAEVLQPDQRFELRVEIAPGGDRVRFRLSDGDRLFASGRCLLSTDASLNPCLLIPIYDHKDEIRGVVEALAAHELPCLVIDDGSDDATQEVLAAIAHDFPWVEVHRRKQNGGRGAALKTGDRLAAHRRFSHVIQLDADGQHDAADVPRFLEAWRRDPEALLLGAPIFDESVPKSRLYGRQISRVLVWFFTLSGEIRDPLCGFRGLPVDAVLRVIDESETGDHMEFDPELLVRLFWNGARVVTIPTKVVYNPHGLSHFDVVWDDLRLAGVYTRFFGSMVPRVPRLFSRHLRGRR
ncbi:MAG: glycosyltransferase [Proteobacteria bacterium]|nr:glycosyltransferase [Pseudomonadota bacterium]